MCVYHTHDLRVQRAPHGRLFFSMEEEAYKSESTKVEENFRFEPGPK